MTKEIRVIEKRKVLGKDFQIYGDFENPLFLAKDVAKILELTNVSDMISRIDEDEVTKLNLGGLQGECNFLTEDGLYESLMQSRKPIAKEFKKEIKKILKTIRKTGGYIANSKTFVDMYFSTVDDLSKKFLVEILDKKLEVEKQLKETKEQLEYKSEIIEGFVENLDIYKKKDIINRIVKSSKGNYANRYNEVYKLFKELYSIDLKARTEGYNSRQVKKKDNLSVIKYAEKFGHVDDMYNVVVKLYETEVKQILKDIYNIVEVI